MKGNSYDDVGIKNLSCFPFVNEYCYFQLPTLSSLWKEIYILNDLFNFAIV